jgi:hypothetical protein
MPVRPPPGTPEVGSLRLGQTQGLAHTGTVSGDNTAHELALTPLTVRLLLKPRRFANLIGRFRTMATGERARKMVHGTGELVGITLRDDLTRFIPSEAAMLGVPALRAVFAAKLAEAQLMVYDTRGEELAGKGAIIACIDCSASMEAGVGGRWEPTREAWAKACALALLDQARNSRPRRDFAAIFFSSSHQTKLFHFPADQPVAIADVLEMGEHFFDGGTSFTAPPSTRPPTSWKPPTSPTAPRRATSSSSPTETPPSARTGWPPGGRASTSSASASSASPSPPAPPPSWRPSATLSTPSAT